MLLLGLYTLISGSILVYLKADILWVVGVLSLVPTLVFWRLEKLQRRLLPIVLFAAGGLIVLFEAIAYTNGVWYELSPNELRIFGLFPVEVLIAAFTHLLYYIVVYEYFFDDKKTSLQNKPRVLKNILLAISILIALGLSYIYLFSSLIISYAFGFLLLVGFTLFFVGVGFVRRGWWRVVIKTALFATAIYPISLIYEYVALSNNLRFFANINEYIYSFTVLDQPLPVEELLFIWLVPFWLITIYELYLDDRK